MIGDKQPSSSSEDSFDLFGFEEETLHQELHGKSPSDKAVPEPPEAPPALPKPMDLEVDNNLQVEQTVPKPELQKHVAAEQEAPQTRPIAGGKSLINIFKMLKRSKEGDKELETETRRQTIARYELFAKRVREHLEANSSIMTFDTKPLPTVQNRKVRRRLTDTVDDTDEYGGDVDPMLKFQPRLIKNGVLTEHQLVGLNWLINLYRCNANGLLADQMGLGKTIQTIAFLAYLREVENIRKTHLIVCPLSVVENWKNEFTKWYPDCRVGTFSATKDMKAENLRILDNESFDVLISSYEGLTKNLARIMQKRFIYFIIDEAHKIKNEQTRFSEESRRVPSAHRLLLTGTPLSNNPSELWSLLNFIMPNLFDTKDLFEKLFPKKIQEEADDAELTKEEIVQALHRIISPFMLRRLKHDTNIQLKPKREIHIHCPMTALQKTAYKRLLHEKSGSDRLTLNNLIIQLRKASIHPFLFEEYWPEGEPITRQIVTASGKFIVLEKMLDKFVLREKTKVLLFSQFTSVLDIIEDFLGFKQIPCYRLDGSTPVQDRNRFMREFNDPTNPIRIFILSTRAGGLGINLTAASIVIMMDSDWNPQMDLQAMDRAHRMGQQKDVFVFRLITSHSIEEKIIERQIKKLKIDFVLLEKGRHYHRKQATQFSLNQLAERDIKDLAFFGASYVLKVGEEEDLEEMDIDKLIEESEHNTELMKKELEQKVIEFGEKVLEFGQENNYEKFLEMNGREECMKALSYEELQKTYNEGELRKKERKLNLQLLGQIEYFHQQVSLPEAHQFYSDPVMLVYLRARQARQLYAATHRLPLKAEDKLTAEQKGELEAIEKSGFPGWSKTDFLRFVHYSGKYGRLSIEYINRHLFTKTAEEVYRYACVFWQRLDELENCLEILNNIEFREHKVSKRTAISELISEDLRDNNPSFFSIDFPLEVQEQLRKSAGPHFNELLDKFLLFTVSRVGLGRWKEVRERLLRTEVFAEDWFARTRDEQDLKLRYQTVLRIYSSQFELKLKKFQPSEYFMPFSFEEEYRKKYTLDNDLTREEKLNIEESLAKQWGYGRKAVTLRMFEHWKPLMLTDARGESESEPADDKSRSAASRFSSEEENFDRRAKRPVKLREDPDKPLQKKRGRPRKTDRLQPEAPETSEPAAKSGKSHRRNDSSSFRLEASSTPMYEPPERNSIINSEEQNEDVEDLRVLHNMNMDESSSDASR